MSVFKNTFFFLIFILISNRAFAYQTVHDAPVFSSGRTKLCALNSLYLTMKFFGRPVDYPSLMSAFPDLEDEGISLFQAKAFLESKNLFCQSAYKTELEMTKLPREVVCLILKEEQNIAHIYLVRANRNGLQIMDRDNAVPLRIKNDFSDNQKYFCLQVSKVPFPAEKFSWILRSKWLFYALGLFSFAMLGLVIFRKRTKHENT